MKRLRVSKPRFTPEATEYDVNYHEFRLRAQLVASRLGS